MSDIKLPTEYTKLTPAERRLVREQYITQQEGKCMYCNNLLLENPTMEVMNKAINWDLFPLGFRLYPIHLQHCHKTDMTEGAVHMKCNAVLWQYYKR